MSEGAKNTIADAASLQVLLFVLKCNEPKNKCKGRFLREGRRKEVECGARRRFGIGSAGSRWNRPQRRSAGVDEATRRARCPGACPSSRGGSLAWWLGGLTPRGGRNSQVARQERLI